MVINAIDAMPQEGNLWISTRVDADSTIELVIRDDGIGIPAEHLPHIFEPFYTTKEVGRLRTGAGHQPEHRGAPWRAYRGELGGGPGNDFQDCAAS